MIAGAMLVMGACVLGGLTAVVLMLMQQRTGSYIVAIAAGFLIVVGIVIQVGGFRKLKAASASLGNAAKGGSK
jgi:hypothetical protein